MTIFTDDPDDYNDGFCSRLPTNIDIQPTFSSTLFDVQSSLCPWSTFENKEQISGFEKGQLNQILKKFVKQLASGPQMKGSDSSESFTMSFDKLINVTTNLTKPHV